MEKPSPFEGPHLVTDLESHKKVNHNTAETIPYSVILGPQRTPKKDKNRELELPEKREGLQAELRMCVKALRSREHKGV